MVGYDPTLPRVFGIGYPDHCLSLGTEDAGVENVRMVEEDRGNEDGEGNNINER